MKRIISCVVGFLFFATAGVAVAAPVLEYRRTILPETTNTYDLGSSLKQWLTGYFGTICLSGDCKSAWPTGGGGSGIGWAWNSINMLRTTTTTDDVLIGRTATTTNSKLEVNGTTTATVFVATSTTASSTFGNGITLTNGCFKVNGSCLTSGGTPGGSDTQVQFNDAGSFGGDAELTYDKTNNVLSTAGSINSPNHLNSTGVWGVFLEEATGIVIRPDFSKSVAIEDSITSAKATLDTSIMTAARSYQFPDKDGTFAMLSDIVSGSGSGNVATSSTEIRGQIPYWTSNGGTPATLGTVATTSLAVTGPITFSGTLGAQVGGVAGSFGCATCATFTYPFPSSATTSALSLANITFTNATGTAATTTNLFSGSVFGNSGTFGVLTASGTSFATQSSIPWLTITNSTTTRATTTNLFASIASTSQLYLATGACSGSNALNTNAAGLIVCGAVSGSGSGAANATNTVDWIIYPYGSNVAVWRTKTQSAVTTFADFDDAANYIVNLATSSSPAETSIYVTTGTYQVNASTTIDGKGVGFSAPKFFWYGNGTSTMLVVNNNTSAFDLRNRARVHFENIGFNLNGGADAFYASTTQTSPVSSIAESEFFGIKAYSSGVNHTGWVFHFKDAFRYHIMDFHAKDVGNCFSDENNYSNASFINGDGQIDGFNFCELNNPTAGVNNGGRVVSIYGRQGLVNQMVLKNINGITNSNNSTMFYINHASRVVIEDNNSEQFATTTDVINSNGVNMRTTKYMTPWNGLSNATLVSTDANSYNNTFSLAEVELSAATYVFRDANTIAPTRPNVMQGYDGGDFTLQDNGGSVLWATTTSTIVRDVYDNITGANSYLGRVKVTGGNILMDFLNSRTTFIQYANSAYRWFVAGTERMNLSSTGDLTLPTGGFAANASSSFQNFTGLNATTSAATTTNLAVANSPIFTALSGLLRGNGSSPLTAAVNGTDFTLITAKTCTAGDFVSAVTAAGVFTCSTPTGGGGGGSGIGWTWNSINSLRMTTTTDDLLVGASATSSMAKIEAIDDGIIAWFASTTGATIRPIFTAFRDITTGISGIGVNSSSTEDALTVNGRANFDPMLDGCDLIGIGTVTTDQLAGQLCDWLALDSITDGGIFMGTPDVGVEANMPLYTILRSGDTTSWASNEGVWIKSHRAVPATTTVMMEALLRTPNVNVATTTGTYVFGFGNVGAGSLTTTAAYTAPTDTCSFQASSTPNWIAVVRKASTYNAWTNTGIATSTTLSTFRRFRITNDLVNGCQFYVDGSIVASASAANSPTKPMQFVIGEGNNGAGVGTIGTSQNHYFYFAEQKMGWGRWKLK